MTMTEYQLAKLPAYARTEIARLQADVDSLEAKLYAVTTRNPPPGSRLLVDPYPHLPMRALPWGTLLRWTFAEHDHIEVHAEKDAPLIVRANDRIIVEPRAANTIHVGLHPSDRSGKGGRDG